MADISTSLTTSLTTSLRQALAPRPWWMNAMMLFCLYMAVVYLPWDIFIKPVEGDQEVFFGYMFTDWGAKLTAPIHWAIYAAGAWGFWKMRPWMHPWAALYVAQIAIGMFVWALLDERGLGWWSGAIAAVPFAALTWVMWRAKDRFTGVAATQA
jgi:hypothetical protein